jgi:prepilin-type N-terminal cleavage/methylation domain-containing protein
MSATLKKKKIPNEAEKGLTLAEMLVTIFIFSTVLGAASGIFVSAIKNQSRALSSQQILNQASYIMEYTGKAIRMAKKDIEGSCISTKLNYATTTTGSGGIRFKNHLDQCQEFFRECVGGGCRLKEKKGPLGGEIENYLTSPNLYIESFNIGPSDSWDQNDDLQPRVTMFLEIKKTGLGPQPKIKIQTAISQRRLDINE